MEEQRQRQEEEERRAQVESAQGGEKTTTAMETGKPLDSFHLHLLNLALKLSNFCSCF